MSASIALSLTISRLQTKQPEGILTTMSGFNGQYLGPDIVVAPGDRIIATVTNHLANYTTVHWHGMIQKNGDNNMDGVPYVSQLPIPPGGIYVYNFTVDGSGTFWYHSHSLNQYVDGVLGALIVRAPAETNIYNDRILLLKDYYRKEVLTYLASYLSPGSGGAEPIPDNVLINGIGQTTTCRTNQNCSYVTVQSSTFTQFCGMYSTYSAVLTAQALAATSTITSDNKITRLKLIAGNAIAVLNISVDGHNMWVLSLDGMPIVPVRLTSFLLNAGQRMDVALCRQNPVLSTPAWIRVNVDVDSIDDPTAMVNLGPLGILYYSGDREIYGMGAKNVVHYSHTTTTDVLSTQSNSRSILMLPSGIPYNQGTQHSNDTIDEFNDYTGKGINKGFVADTTVYPNLFPPPAATKTYTIPLIMFANNATNKITMASFDGISYVQPKTNLLALVKAGSSFPKASPPHPLAFDGSKDPGVLGFNYLQFSSNDVVQLVINNYDGGEHPIHIHGRRLYVMGMGLKYAGTYSASTDILNSINPPLRDTVTVNPMSWIVLRFADHNPGVWPLHCHIDWHMAAGLFMVLYETTATKSTVLTPTSPPSTITKSLPTSATTSSSSSSEEPSVSTIGIIVGVVGGGGLVLLCVLYMYCRGTARRNKVMYKQQQLQEQQQQSQQSQKQLNGVDVDLDNDHPHPSPFNDIEQYVVVEGDQHDEEVGSDDAGRQQRSYEILSLPTVVSSVTSVGQSRSSIDTDTYPPAITYSTVAVPPPPPPPPLPLTPTSIDDLKTSHDYGSSPDGCDSDQPHTRAL